MRLHRFFLPFDTTAGQICIEDTAVVHQMKNVFRYKRGDRVILCDGKDNEAIGEIQGITQNNIIVAIHHIQKTGREAFKKVILVCAVLKKDNFEMVVQKATEAGVSEIYPLITDHTIKMNLRTDRLHIIAQEASEQSGRGIVPVIHEPIDFKAFQNLSVHKKSQVYVCDETGQEMKISSQMKKGSSESIYICIGPEGGWSDQELQNIQTLGWTTVSLGPRVLRAETAAVVMSFMAVNHEISI